ncbi:MAG: hypothetical protein GY866_26330 [Proteobacteria bacterium]|nr:hypothetical protein [Pseudomonadota bacterium]
MNSYLSEPYMLAGKRVPNRFVAQAMEINSAEAGGAVGRQVVERYKDLAGGGWGMVFLEATSITEEHLARDKGLILNRKNLDGFKRMVDAFKSVGPDSLFLFQLTHSGRQSGDFSRKVKVYSDEHTEIPILSESELDEVRYRFIDAVALAKEAGADGVDVKSCHGYLGSELLRPLNVREDRYGGSAENRAYLASSVIASAVKEFPDLVLGSRVSIFEGIRGGCGTAGPDEIIENLEDVRQVLSNLVKAGAHYLNVSAGIPPVTPQITRPSKKGMFSRLHHFRYAKAIKDFFPDTTVVGSAYSTGDPESLSLADENLGKGYTDFVGYGRQNLADPSFPEKAIRAPETVDYCTLCGKCSQLLKKNEKVHCATYGKA